MDTPPKQAASSTVDGEGTRRYTVYCKSSPLPACRGKVQRRIRTETYLRCFASLQPSPRLKKRIMQQPESEPRHGRASASIPPPRRLTRARRRPSYPCLTFKNLAGWPACLCTVRQARDSSPPRHHPSLPPSVLRIPRPASVEGGVAGSGARQRRAKHGRGVRGRGESAQSHPMAAPARSVGGVKLFVLAGVLRG